MQILVGHPLRLGETFVERLGDPPVLLVDVPPDGHEVHDRENPGPLEVLALRRMGILEQAAHFSGPHGKRDGARGENSASISPDSSIADERLRRADPLDL